ncbi:DUF5789 family protein [Natrinema longum]|uniref:DUF2795 domain-containing protein n=1 Tax=Natrinema longum TaxID=370324 RepID=A0A8A2UAU1_9EURY|nr:hypothetical protein [Natrinema longum]MBZ6496373.1 hypothetical protein [Natrinema longum]QSW85717.1 hypothetical protein J0X27_02420 [Natrinema longum]
MSDPTDSERLREHGVEFGPLAHQLDQHEYPTTCEELVEAYGSAILRFQDGEQTLEEVLNPVREEQFDSPAEARTAIFSNVSEGAIGRKGYSDRTPPALGEQTEEPDESF